MRLSARVAIVGLAGALTFLGGPVFQHAKAQETIDGGQEVDCGAKLPDTLSPGAILAHYCGDAEMKCMTTPVHFSYTHRLFPKLPNWDTGWIPKDFKMLQVRFELKFPTDTTVDLNGQFQAAWPQALTLSAPGDRFGGFMKFDYGMVISSLGKIDIQIGGGSLVKWEGKLPYLPNFSFKLLGEKQFDSWAFNPDAVTAHAFTKRATLFRINVLQLAKIPAEVVAGGVALDIEGELQGTYKTENMKFSPNALPITSQDGTTVHQFAGGPFVEIDMMPEGRISYDGIIHLIPTFWVEIAKWKEIEIPFYDYPISITKLLNLELGQQIVFDKVTIHVPLPDIPVFEQEAVMDFGKVVVGTGNTLEFDIPNHGEARAKIVGEVEPDMKKYFKVQGASTKINPGETVQMAVRFTPKQPGRYEALLTLSTNDPDNPTQQIKLLGQAYSTKEALDSDDTSDWENNNEHKDPNGASATDSGGGCSCRLANAAAGSGTTYTPWWLLAGALIACIYRVNRSTHRKLNCMSQFRDA